MRLSQAHAQHACRQLCRSTVLKQFGSLKHLLTLCVDDWGCLTKNPVGGVKAPRAGKPPKIFFTEEEVALLEKEAQPWLRPLITLGVQTGLRRANICGLRWGWINLDLQAEEQGRERSPRIHVPEEFMKSDDLCTVPLTASALELLERMYFEQGRPKKGSVWQDDTRQKHRIYVSGRFRILMRRLGIDEGQTFHTLRHTFGSWMAMPRVPSLKLMVMIGHHDLRMVVRYQHLSEKHIGTMFRSLGGPFRRNRTIPTSQQL